MTSITNFMARALVGLRSPRAAQLRAASGSAKSTHGMPPKEPLASRRSNPTRGVTAAA